MEQVAKRAGRFNEIWSYDVGGEITCNAVVHDINGDHEQEVLVATKKGVVYCLKGDGTVLWQYNAGKKVSKKEAMFLDEDAANEIHSAPIVVDAQQGSIILFGTQLGLVHAVDSTGKQLWVFEAGGPITSSLLVADVNGDDVLEVIFGSHDGHLYTLNAQGKLLKKTRIGGHLTSAPSYNPEREEVLIGDHNGLLHALKDNKEIWQFATEGPIISQPKLSQLTGSNDTFVVVASSDGFLYTLTADGKLVWKYETGGAIVGDVKLADFNKDKRMEIVFGSTDNNAYTLNARGDKIWSYETNFWVTAEPIIADVDNDGKPEVIIGSYDHSIYILDTEGDYSLDYVPGLSGVVHQAGSYADVLTSEPGENVAKRLWAFKTKGIIMGLALNKNNRTLIVTTKNGLVSMVAHIKQ